MWSLTLFFSQPGDCRQVDSIAFARWRSRLTDSLPRELRTVSSSRAARAGSTTISPADGFGLARGLLALLYDVFQKMCRPPSSMPTGIHSFRDLFRIQISERQAGSARGSRCSNVKAGHRIGSYGQECCNSTWMKKKSIRQRKDQTIHWRRNQMAGHRRRSENSGAPVC